MDDGDLDTRLEAIRARLRAAAARDPGDRFALGAPAAEAQVAAIEAEERTLLPAAYRRFVTELGDGGAGPGYGLLPLEEAVEAAGRGIYLLGDPFMPPVDRCDFTRLDGPGVLVLCERGGGRYDGLVVTGAPRGEVWTYAPDRPGWRPLPGRPDLLTWYGAWLDRRGAG